MARKEGVNIHGSSWVRGSESGWSYSVRAYVLMNVSRSECRWRRRGNSEVGASADDSITTMMGHIWWETEAKKWVNLLSGEGRAMCGSYAHCLTHTSTVEASLCFPSTAALRPVCPESRDWTSFHTWGTQRQTDSWQGCNLNKLNPQLGPFPYLVTSQRRGVGLNGTSEILQPFWLCRFPCPYVKFKLSETWTQPDWDSVGGRQELYCRWSDLLLSLRW